MTNARQRTVSTADRYVADRHEFRKAELTLPDGRLFGEVEEKWQQEFVWNPLDERLEDGQWRYRLVYFELARGHAKSFSGAAEALFLCANTESNGGCNTRLANATPYTVLRMVYQ